MQSEFCTYHLHSLLSHRFSFTSTSTPLALAAYSKHFIFYFTESSNMDPNPNSSNHSVRYLILLILLVFVKDSKAINFQPFPAQDIYTRPDYGVIFRPIPNTFVPTDSYFHVFFELPFPVIPTFPNIPTIDTSQCVDQSQSFSAHFSPTTEETHRYFYGLLQPALQRAIALSTYDPSGQWGSCQKCSSIMECRGRPCCSGGSRTFPDYIAVIQMLGQD